MPDQPEQTAYEIPQRMLVLRDFCIRTAGSDCDRCQRACPADAVRLAAGAPPTVDAGACTACGVCLGICDAFSSTNTTVSGIYDQVRRIAVVGDTPLITCEEMLSTDAREKGTRPGTVVVPCLAALAPELWTLVLANGPATVALDLAACEHCERGGALGGTLATGAIEMAEEWTGQSVGFRDLSAEASSDGQPRAIGRRDAITDLLDTIADAASGRRRLRQSEELQRFTTQRENMNMRANLNLDEGAHFNRFAHRGRVRKIMHPKRRMVLEALEADRDLAQRIPVTLSTTDYDRCDNSLACTRTCPTGARLPHAETGALVFDPRFCIGCGLCAQACPHDAVAMEETTAAALQ